MRLYMYDCDKPHEPLVSVPDSAREESGTETNEPQPDRVGHCPARPVY